MSVVDTVLRNRRVNNSYEQYKPPESVHTCISRRESNEGERFGKLEKQSCGRLGRKKELALGQKKSFPKLSFFSPAVSLFPPPKLRVAFFSFLGCFILVTPSVVFLSSEQGQEERTVLPHSRVQTDEWTDSHGGCAVREEHGSYHLRPGTE